MVILSVTEGEDKPLKYPDMFRAARLMLLNKCDLLQHLDFDFDFDFDGEQASLMRGTSIQTSR